MHSPACLPTGPPLPASCPTPSLPCAPGSAKSRPRSLPTARLFCPTHLAGCRHSSAARCHDSLTPAFAIGLPDGAGNYEDPWILPLASDGIADAVVWLEPAGPPANWATVLATRAAAATDILTLVGLARNLAPDAFAGTDLYTLANGLNRLANFLAAGDGVVSTDSQFPTGATWTKGTPIAAAHSAQPQDPGAIAQIKAQIDSLAGGAANPRIVLLLGPAFSDHTIWSTLIGASPTANFNLARRRHRPGHRQPDHRHRSR